MANRVPTLREIEPFVRDGWINQQRHPSLPLTINNYTNKTQFARKWTDITKVCRGLILHDDGRVIARPFPKIFNLEEMPRSWNPPSKEFVVTSKEDGSLGIIYRTPDGIAMATRGSFTGDQAVKATEMVQQYVGLPWDTDRFTYLFEVIYPENRIVVDYGDDERLVLLAVIDTKTGKDVDLPDWFPNHVQSWPDLTDLSQLQSMARPNAEGFVVRFKNDFRVKCKFPDYVRLHKLIAGLSEKVIWEYLSIGKGLVDILTDTPGAPDEAYDWIHSTADRLWSEFYAIESECDRDFYDKPVGVSRKELAAYFSTCLYPHVLFLKTDGHHDRAEKAIWDLVKPKGPKSFRESEAA